MENKLKKEKRLTPAGTFLLHLAVGAVIGIGGVLPGVSGGVMAVSLGIYKPMIDALAGFFKSPRKNCLFLLPIGIGAVVGFLLGAVALSGLMERWYTQVMWLFLGLVAGGIPSFIKEANERGFKWRYLIATAAPILSEGDVMGCVLFVGTEDALSANEVDYKLVQTVSGFLGRHMES